MAISAVTTRRAFLHALPAATIALGTPALASTSLPDPVFAAIAQREAVRDFINSPGLPDETVDATGERICEVENQLAQTPPQTVDGAIALLRVFRRDFVDNFELEYQFEQFLLTILDNSISALEGAGCGKVGDRLT